MTSSLLSNRLAQTRCKGFYLQCQYFKELKAFAHNGRNIYGSIGKTFRLSILRSGMINLLVNSAPPKELLMVFGLTKESALRLKLIGLSRRMNLSLPDVSSASSNASWFAA